MIGPIVGCGIISPYQRNSEGYYERHYWTCGPIALEKAFNAVYTRDGIVFVRDPFPRGALSKEIQKRGMKLKELLSFFNKEAICITWPSDIKHVAEHHGFKLTKIDDIDSLDPAKDIAIVLIHGRHFSKEYHWIVYPIDDVKNFYEKKTVIDTIYLLKWKDK
jgi:hypothetical protein